MKQLIQVWAVALVAACGGEDAPSCSQAFNHYYDNGCAFVDLQTGQQIPRNSLIAACQMDLSNVPDRCKGDLDTFLTCVGNVPPSAADCDCSSESDDYLSCL